MPDTGVDFGALMNDLDTSDAVLFLLIMLAQSNGKIAATTAAASLGMSPTEYMGHKRAMSMAGQRLALRLVPDTRRKEKGAA